MKKPNETDQAGIDVLAGSAGEADQVAALEGAL